MVQAWAAMDGVMPVQMGINLLRILRKLQFPHWTGEGNPEGISGCQCVATSLVATGAPTRRQRGICLPGCQHCHQTGHLPCHSCPCLYHPVQEEREFSIQLPLVQLEISADWMMPDPLVRADLYQPDSNANFSRATLRDMVRNNVFPALWATLSLVK